MRLLWCKLVLLVIIPRGVKNIYQTQGRHGNDEVIKRQLSSVK